MIADGVWEDKPFKRRTNRITLELDKQVKNFFAHARKDPESNDDSMNQLNKWDVEGVLITLTSRTDLYKDGVNLGSDSDEISSDEDH